jgi:hypothetical protein
MSQPDGNRTLLRFPGEEHEFSVARPSTHDYAMLEELSFVRREAQAEANAAYEHWRLQPRSSEGYAVYRAAQDRADAAQDELARWMEQIARPRISIGTTTGAAASRRRAAPRRAQRGSSRSMFE